MTVTDLSSATAMVQAAAIIAYLTRYTPEDYVFRKRNSEDCWYPPTCNVITAVPAFELAELAKYTKESAINDAQAQVKNIFDEFADDELPKIYEAMNGSGGYNSTTAQLLANDAYARTVAKSAQIVLANIKDYGSVRNADMTGLSNIIGSVKGSYAVVTVSTAAQGVDAGTAFTAAMGMAQGAISGNGRRQYLGTDIT